MKQPWPIFFQNHFPFVFYLVLSGGITLSVMTLSLHPIDFLSFFLLDLGVFIGCVGFQLIREWREFDFRPIIKLQTLKETEIEKKQLLSMFTTFILMSIGYSVVSGVFFGIKTIISYLLLVGYLYLMRMHFFRLKQLHIERILEGIALIFFVVFVASYESILFIYPNTVLFYAMTLFFSYTLFMLTKQLNPNLHPSLQTLIQYYGYHKIFYLALFYLICSAIFSWLLQKGWILWPFQAVLLICFVVLFFSNRRYTLAVIAATISLYVHAYVMIFP